MRGIAEVGVFMSTTFNANEFELESSIIAIIRRTHPMTGQGLSDHFSDVPPMQLWRICYKSENILIQNCARYYLRYDVTRTNMLRLSPSILRDFLTFSLIYLPDQAVAVVESGTRMANAFRMISIRKLSYARQALMRLPEILQAEIYANCVVFLSGDIAYFLAHDTERQHATMGTPIKGSDIDIVIINNLEANPENIKKIEDEFLKIKRQFLATPAIREELDFIVKPMGRMLDQLQYRDIHQKIATKILYESYFLMGRVDIYQALMGHLEMSGALEKIEADFETALTERKQTIGKILKLPFLEAGKDDNVNSLFFASQERLEFT